MVALPVLLIDTATWLQNMAQETITKNPVKKLHRMNTSYFVTIDPSHVKRLAADDQNTFFEQEPIEDGILLRMRRLT